MSGRVLALLSSYILCDITIRLMLILTAICCLLLQMIPIVNSSYNNPQILASSSSSSSIPTFIFHPHISTMATRQMQPEIKTAAVQRVEVIIALTIITIIIIIKKSTAQIVLTQTIIIHPMLLLKVTPTHH